MLYEHERATRTLCPYRCDVDMNVLSIDAPSPQPSPPSGRGSKGTFALASTLREELFGGTGL